MIDENKFGDSLGEEAHQTGNDAWTPNDVNHEETSSKEIDFAEKGNDFMSHERDHEEIEQTLNHEEIHQGDASFNTQEIPQQEPFGEPTKALKVDKPKRGMGRFVTGLVIVSLVGGVAIGSSFAYVSHMMGNGSQNSVPSTPISNPIGGNVQPVATNTTITDIANSVGPSVVSIYNTKSVSTIFGNYDQSGLGSGVIFKEDADKIYMITNAHVVEGATTLAVNFLGDTKVECTLVGQDTTNDIAVVSVNKADVPAETLSSIAIATLGDSDQIQVGQLAVAIGTPMEAAFNNTVTAGVISATNREVQISGDKTMQLIQTDAAINPGNSGGALVGPSGEVIGINTVKLVDSSVEGMGFAIPMNTVRPIVEEILQNGTIVRPSLGIVGKNVSAETSELYELPIGVYVVQVAEGGSADIGGIQPNDVIFEFDGQQLQDMDQLKSLLNNKRVGDEVEVKVIRNKEKKVLKIKLKDVQASIDQGNVQNYYGNGNGGNGGSAYGNGYGSNFLNPFNY